jgi:voltage-gated potassium channel
MVVRGAEAGAGPLSRALTGAPLASPQASRSPPCGTHLRENSAPRFRIEGTTVTDVDVSRRPAADVSASPGPELGDMTRVARWERRTEVPLILLAVAFLVAYAWPVLDPRMGAGLRESLVVVSWTVWVAFAIDLAIRLVLADDRKRYANKHWYDVALVLLPVLRPLRLLRLLALVRILDRSASHSLAGRVLVYVGGASSLAVVLGALAVLDAERGAPGATITSFGDALWWACATVMTVGYGDVYPVTGQGRAVAVVLMVVGIGTVGAVTASFASWMVARVAAEQGAKAAAKAAEAPHDQDPDSRATAARPGQRSR